MNIKEFIENSGILEEYVLGLLSDTEAQGVECLAKTYPEIKEEIVVLENSLNSYASLYERKPPASLKEQIFAQMEFAEDIALPTEATEVEQEELTPSISEVKVIPLWSKLSLAASVLLAAVTAWVVTQNTYLKDQTASMEQRLNAVEGDISQKAELLAVYQNPDIKVVKMLGVEGKENNAATVLWNNKDNSVHVQVNNLPKPTSGMQYQLWYIGDDGPIDMGMIDNDFGDKTIAMKHVNGKPNVFAITLEKEGGVPSPTLEQLQVIGNV